MLVVDGYLVDRILQDAPHVCTIQILQVLATPSLLCFVAHFGSARVAEATCWQDANIADYITPAVTPTFNFHVCAFEILLLHRAALQIRRR